METNTQKFFEEVKINKFLDGVSPSTIVKFDSYGAFKFLVRGIFESMSPYIKNDPKTTCDFVLMTRAGGLFQLSGYIKFQGEEGEEKIRISHIFQ